ncbi:hypothetical protein F4553_007528 [Allocatelliglobosispora scoriae]|uniref:ATP-grasp domain-containing protein n=1 Tax=Allocatelliglobosispora scoriae TaxID=643052 RepID=A0A841C150_9ACTN|nr:ATP-grasp domain-containing protein [Allocatelliglobosispora scoriae]MBB5874094.1 hypothetical protein [Allocatelliglobosispora scoriae]
MGEGFTRRLKTALTGDAAARFVFIGNVEVERQWAVGAISLPRMSFGASDVVVNRMDELAITLAGADDYVLLKTAPDPAYLSYLAELGFELPTVVAVAGQDPGRMVTEDALADETVIEELRRIASPGTYLLPHGISALEEELARRTRIEVAGPSAAVCRAVNSKVYSRRVADELGLRQPQGWACDDLDEFAAAVTAAHEVLAAGRRVVVKDAFGVSGKGIVVVDDPRRLDRLHRMVVKEVERDAAQGGHGRVALLIEEWVAKDVDLNYQFTIGTGGGVHFDFVKRAVTQAGVHKGHQMPSGLDGAQLEQVHRATALLGDRLAADGFSGVVGVDAMLDPAGGVYPVTEINARSNMSTYQATLAEKLIGPDAVALARHFDLKLTERLPFDRLRDRLGGLLLDRAGGAGLIVNAFATVNAGATEDGGPFTGRLYGVLVADSAAELEKIDTQIEGAIHE